MQTLRDFMRVCSHAKKKGGSRKAEQRSRNRYAGRLSCHSLVAATEQVKRAESETNPDNRSWNWSWSSNPAELEGRNFSYTSCRWGGPASVSVWTCFPSPQISFDANLWPQNFCKFLFAFSGYFRSFFFRFYRSQLGLRSGHFVFFDKLLQLPNWTNGSPRPLNTFYCHTYICAISFSAFLLSLLLFSYFYFWFLLFTILFSVISLL